VLPLKDDIPTDRLPVVTLLLVAANVGACLLVPHGGVLVLLATMLFLWIFGANVEDAMSRPRFAALCALGGGAAAGALLLTDPDAAVEPVAAAGVTAAVVGAYLRHYPRARIMSVAPVPFAVTLVAVPAWAWVATWFALQAIFAATALSDGAAALLAQAVAFAAGLLAIRALAQRRKLQAPPPPAIAALP
jgi:membrane associated rhomboid family serine protease